MRMIREGGYIGFRFKITTVFDTYEMSVLAIDSARASFHSNNLKVL